MKQGLGEQELYREQDNSHLEWPDHTRRMAKSLEILINGEGSDFNLHHNLPLFTVLFQGTSPN